MHWVRDTPLAEARPEQTRVVLRDLYFTPDLSLDSVDVPGQLPIGEGLLRVPDRGLTSVRRRTVDRTQLK